VTVFWVAISGHTFHKGLQEGEKGNQTTITFDKTRAKDKQVLYSGYHEVVGSLGDDMLGVRRSSGTKAGPLDMNGLIQINGSILPNDPDLDTESKKLPFFEKITTNLVSKQLGIPARVDFGFVFRRKATVRTYHNGQGTPVPKLSFNEKVDDSLQEFQDVDPNTFNKKQTIVDVDGPGTNLSTTVFFFGVRFSFVEYVGFSFFKNEPERCSEQLKWAVTIDSALGYGNPKDEGKAVFIRGFPNLLGSNINEVLVGKHLPNLDVFAPEPKITNVVDTKGKPLRVFKKGDVTFVTVTGTNLIGEFVLRKGKDETKPAQVRVKVTNAPEQFSDLSEAEAMIQPDLPEGKDYEFVIRNASKKDAVLKGFEIIK